MSERPIQEDDFGTDSTTQGPADAPPGVPAGVPAPSGESESESGAEVDDDGSAETEVIQPPVMPRRRRQFLIACSSSPRRCPRRNCTSTSRARWSRRWSSRSPTGMGCAERTPLWPTCAGATAFSDLGSFLHLYYECMSVLITREDFAQLSEAYLRRAVHDGVRHVELFFDPQAHTTRGVDIDTVIDGLQDGFAAVAADSRPDRRPADVLPPGPTGLRGHGHVEVRRARFGDLLGVGLDSAEVGYPPSLFAEVFAAARAAGLRLVSHAGEEGPPEYVREALDVLGVERIDHGVRSLEDPALVERLSRDQIPLTVCPLSNLRLGVVSDLARTPAAGDAETWPARHGQLRRPGVLRRLSGRQLRSRRGDRLADPSRPRTARRQLDHGIVCLSGA